MGDEKKKELNLKEAADEKQDSKIKREEAQETEKKNEPRKRIEDALEMEKIKEKPERKYDYGTVPPLDTSLRHHESEDCCSCCCYGDNELNITYDYKDAADLQNKQIKNLQLLVYTFPQILSLMLHILLLFINIKSLIEKNLTIASGSMSIGAMVCIFMIYLKWFIPDLKCCNRVFCCCCEKVDAKKNGCNKWWFFGFIIPLLILNAVALGLDVKHFIICKNEDNDTLISVVLATDCASFLTGLIHMLVIVFSPLQCCR